VAGVEKLQKTTSTFEQWIYF